MTKRMMKVEILDVVRCGLILALMMERMVGGEAFVEDEVVRISVRGPEERPELAEDEETARVPERERTALLSLLVPLGSAEGLRRGVMVPWEDDEPEEGLMAVN